MIQSIEGIYHDGKVELLGPAPSRSKSRVIITFLPAPAPVKLRSRKIGRKQAANLRTRLKTFQEDWNRPEMDVYDSL